MGRIQWMFYYTSAIKVMNNLSLRRVWRYQRGHQNLYKSKKYKHHNGQKKKLQNYKQPSTKHTHKTKDRVTQTPLNTVGELWCFGSVSSSCSTSCTHHVNLVQWVSDWCLMPNEQYFSYIYYHVQNKLQSMKWCRCLLCTRPTSLIGSF